MSSIGSVSSSNWSNTQALQGNRQARMQERMFQKADADGSGGVDATELQTLLDKAAKKTGTSSDSSTTELLSKSDGNKDGSLSSAELDSVMKSMFPPPSSTQDFLRTRGSGSASSSQSTDDLFGKIDSDSSGGISKSELQSFTDKIKQDQGSSSTSDASVDDMITQLDSDSSGELSQTELQAGSSSGKAHGHGGMPPPPPPAGGVNAAGSAIQSGSSANLDPLDTNEDGVVSAAERAAASSASTAIQDLLKAADGDANGSLNATEIGKLAQQLTEQYAKIASGDFGPGTGSTINVTA